MAAVRGFGGKWIAVTHGHHCICYDPEPNSYTVQMAFVFGWLLEFQCPEESSDLKHNTYNQYKPYNTKCNKNLVLAIFLTRQLLLSVGLEQESTDSLG